MPGSLTYRIMLIKNSFIYGALVALIFPIIAGIVAYLLRTNVDVINRPALPYLIAIALNLILMRMSFKKELDQTGKGMMLTTFICLLLTFFLKIHPLT